MSRVSLDAGSTDAAFAKIVRSVSVSEQSSRRLREKLLRAGYSEQATEEALARALRAGIVDDARYADSLLRRTLGTSRGLAEATREIEGLGFHLEELDSYSDLADEPDEVSRALSYLESHPVRAKNARASAYRKLLGRGFSADVAGTASKRYCELRTEDAFC